MSFCFFFGSVFFRFRKVARYVQWISNARMGESCVPWTLELIPEKYLERWIKICVHLLPAQCSHCLGCRGKAGFWQPCPIRALFLVPYWKDDIPLLATSCPDFWHQFCGRHCRLGHFCLGWFCFISKAAKCRLHKCTRWNCFYRACRQTSQYSQGGLSARVSASYSLVSKCEKAHTVDLTY